MGPNDVRCVVWALGEFFFKNLVFKLIHYIYYFRSYMWSNNKKCYMYNNIMTKPPGACLGQQLQCAYKWHHQHQTTNGQHNWTTKGAMTSRTRMSSEGTSSKGMSDSEDNESPENCYTVIICSKSYATLIFTPLAPPIYITGNTHY